MTMPSLALLTEWIATARTKYRDLLNREPDDAGLASWLIRFSLGTTGEQMHAEVLAGAEYAGLHPPVAPVGAVEPLHIDGTTFTDAECLPWRYQGASAFRLLRQYLDGVDLTPIFDWARPLGVNVFRVFARLSWAGLRETDYSDAQVLSFVRTVGAAGFRVEWVALADCAVTGWELSRAEQWAHVARLARVVGGEPNVLFELANEPSHASNRVDPLAFERPSSGLWSRGSSHADEAPIIPPWDYLTDHCPRKEEWPRTAKNMLEFTRLGYGKLPPIIVPAVGDEPQKIGPTNSLIVRDHRDYAAVAALYAAGSTIHTQSLGIDGVIPTGAEQDCARAIAEAWQAIPTGALLGVYTRGGLDSSPLEHSDSTALRTFGMISGSKATCVIVRKGYDQPVARAGWSITGYGSADKAIVYLER
jgi:hypothetical protein